MCVGFDTLHMAHNTGEKTSGLRPPHRSSVGVPPSVAICFGPNTAVPLISKTKAAAGKAEKKKGNDVDIRLRVSFSARESPVFPSLGDSQPAVVKARLPYCTSKVSVPYSMRPLSYLLPPIVSLLRWWQRV